MQPRALTKGEETKQAILERAAELASQRGLEGLTIGTLAGETGLSKSGLYAHFASKERLCVEVLEFVAQRFVDVVVRPALAAPRGEPRLRALFHNVLQWPERCELPGGCLLIAAITELDDRPGAAREVLVRQQKDWLDTVATVARSAIAEGHFRKDVDPEQVAFELYSLEFAYHHTARLLADPKAKSRTKHAFEALIERCRPARRDRD